MVTPTSFASCLLVAATYLFRHQSEAEQNFAEDALSGVVGDSTELGLIIFQWWPLVVAALVSELVMVLIRRFYQQPATSQDGGSRLSVAIADETDFSDLVKADALVGATGLIAAASTPAGVGNFASNDKMTDLSAIAVLCDAGVQSERDMQAEREMLEMMEACRVQGEEEERLRLRGERVEMEQQLAELRSRLGQAASARKDLERQLHEQGVRLLRAVVHNRKQNDASVVKCEALAEKEVAEVQCEQLKRELLDLRVDLQARETELGQLRSRTNTSHSQWAVTQVRLAAAGEGGLRCEGPQHFDIGSDSSDEGEPLVSDQKSIERCAERRVQSGAEFFARAGISRDQWHARRRTLVGPRQRAPQETIVVGRGTARKVRSCSRTLENSPTSLNSPTGSSTSLEAKHVAHLHPPCIVRCRNADASINPLPCNDISHSLEQNVERRNQYGERHETPVPPFPRDARNGHTHAIAATGKLEVPMASEKVRQSVFFAEALPSQPGSAEGPAPVLGGAKLRDADSSRNADAGGTECLLENAMRHCDSHSHRMPSCASSDSSFFAYSAHRAPHHFRCSPAEASTRAASPESAARSSVAEDISMSDIAICSVNSPFTLGPERVEIEGSSESFQPAAASSNDPAREVEEIYDKLPIDRVSLRIQQFERIARTVRGDRKEGH